MPSKLRAARKAAGLTQAAVARAFGISREAVALWESEGEKGTKPDIRKLQKLAELYNVSISDLLDDVTHSPGSQGDLLLFKAEEILSIWGKMDERAKNEWVKIGGILLGDGADKPKLMGKTVQHPGHHEANHVMKGKTNQDFKKESKK